MNYLLIALLGILAIKSTFFWLYLVQLKEYRINRLIDYFRTTAGKRVLYNPLIPIFTSALRRPKFTKKAILLSFVTLIFQIYVGAFTIIHYPAGAYAVFAFVALFPSVFILWGLILIKPIDMMLRGRILGRATEKMSRLKNLTVIGVTGSYGKTSTKEFLSAILGTKFKVIKTPEHMNVETGIAQFIINKIDDSYDIFICEMGGYEKNDISAICKIVKPKIGILTGVNEQHLALFGSIDNLLSAEGGLELIEVIPKNGFMTINGRNKYTRKIYERAGCKKIMATAERDVAADVWAENIKVSRDRVEFKIFSKKNSVGAEFHANLMGAQNIENILLAAATAEELGINLRDMVGPVSKLKPMDKTMTMSHMSSGVNIIDSSYASNPEGVLAHLEYLKSWGNARKIVVMPCLIELGSASEKRHMQIGEKLASVADLAIITTSEHFSDILLGAKKMIGDKAVGKILLLDNADKVLQQIEKIAGKGDVILLEGRSSENIIQAINMNI